MNDRDALVRSHAGIRLVALSTLYNRGDFARVRTYFKENFAASALEESPVALRIAEMRSLLQTYGKVRLRQLIAYDEHHVVVLMETQNGALIMEDMTVEEAYPHKVNAYTRQLVV